MYTGDWEGSTTPWVFLGRRWFSSVGRWQTGRAVSVIATTPLSWETAGVCIHVWEEHGYVGVHV